MTSTMAEVPSDIDGVTPQWLTAALQAFPSLDTPVVRDLLVPAFTPGWQVYLDKSGAPVAASIARYAERFSNLAPRRITRTDRTSGAAARRHPGGQHVLRR